MDAVVLDENIFIVTASRNGKVSLFKVDLHFSVLSCARQSRPVWSRWTRACLSFAAPGLGPFCGPFFVAQPGSTNCLWTCVVSQFWVRFVDLDLGPFLHPKFAYGRALVLVLASFACGVSAA